MLNDSIKRLVSLSGDYVLLILAGALYAIALKYFVFPAKVILTGTEGISVALSYFLDKEWLFLVLYAAFQCVLLVFAFLKVSRRFAIRSALVVGMVLILLPILPYYQFADPEPRNERILLVIFGGLIAGIAKALAFQRRGSTGDEDILGAYLAMKYLRPVGVIAVMAAVVSTGFGMTLSLIKTQEIEPVVNTLMYTSIYIFVSAEVLNNFYRKFRISQLSIFTKEPKEMGALIQRIYPHRTYTVQDAVGGFSNEGIQIVSTIVTHEELPDIIEAVKREKQAFYSHHEIEGVSSLYYIEPIG
jgi:Uncharacterized conserved protein